jgi:hypothetical protein
VFIKLPVLNKDEDIVEGVQVNPFPPMLLNGAACLVHRMTDVSNKVETKDASDALRATEAEVFVLVVEKASV